MRKKSLGSQHPLLTNVLIKKFANRGPLKVSIATAVSKLPNSWLDSHKPHTENLAERKLGLFISKKLIYLS